MTVESQFSRASAREVFLSVGEMLAPQALSDLTGHQIRSVRLEPFRSVDGLSGSELALVQTNGGLGDQYILKRISRTWDWVMRATGDDRCRQVLSWQTGLLDRLPPEVDAATVACSLDEDGWATLTRDHRPAMIPPGDDPISEHENRAFVEGMVALSVAFWGRSELADPTQGFCSLRQRYASLTPEVGERESGGRDPTPQMIVEGWRLFPSLVEPVVAELISSLHRDPGPLAEALGRYPQTVVHGDWKLGNLGLTGGRTPRIVLLDWAWPGPGPSGVELAWYLAVNSARLPVSKEATIEMYRARLAAALGGDFDEEWWRPQLELALLGGFVLLGWPKAYGAAKGDAAVQARERAELDWWSAWAREGARWL